MTVAEEPIAPRNVFVSFIPASETKIVRFKGSTFGELKGRLTEAKVPGYSPSSFVELQLGEGQFVCLLDNEELPSGELVVTIQQSGSEGEPALGIPGHGPRGWRGRMGCPERPPGGRMHRRFARHMDKLEKMDSKMLHKEAKMQEKVHRMYDRLSRHGQWRYDSPPDEHRGLADAASSSRRPPPPHAHGHPMAPPPPHPHPHHFHHEPYMLYPGPPPGAPQHYEQDPSGAGSIAVPVVKPMANQPQVEEVPELEDSFSDLVLVNKEN